MTTLPTPLFIILCILAAPTVCGLLALCFMLYLFARFDAELRQREKLANEEAVQWVEMYLRQNGGKKWTMH